MNEQRKTQRFDLKLPVELVRANGEDSSRIGETRNLSSGGILFTSDGKLQKGEPIEYLVTLPSHESRGLRLRCMGKVVRVEERKEQPDPLHPSFSIAATLERHEFVRK